MKKPFQLFGFLLALCMAVTLLPPIGLAAGETGTTHTVVNGGDLRSAVDNAGEGDTINLQGTGHVNLVDGEYDAPWSIKRSITIQGGTIDLRPGGIILEADLTLRNVSLSFSNFVRNAIIANGHTLTLENVTCADRTFSVNLFCGGLIPNDFETFPVQAPGPEGRIVILGNTDLQSTELAGGGNIYAGNLCMGGMDGDHNGPGDNGAANVFSGNCVIDLSGSGSTQALGTVYACGAQQRIPIGAQSGKCTYPDPDNYTVAGTVHISGKLIPIRGAGASVVDATYISPNNYLTNLTMTDLSSLRLEKGNLALTQDSNFRDASANLAVSNGATLDLSKLISGAGGTLTIQDLAGGGFLGLGQSQTLCITGAVSGETSVGIGGIFNNASSSAPIQGHTYIRAPQSSASSFRLLPHSSDPNMVLAPDGSGNWTASSGSSGVEGDPIISLRFDPPAGHGTIGQETELPLVVESENNFYASLDFLPLTINVNGAPASRKEEDGYYTYTSRLSELFMTICENTLCVTPYEDGTYSIELVVPKKYTKAGQTLRSSVTLTVGETTQPTPVPVSISVNSTTHKTEYMVGDPLDISGLTIEVAFSDQSRQTVSVTSDMVQGFTSQQAAKKLTLTIQYGDQTTSYDVQVKEAPAPTHTHSWSTAWDSDSTAHWHSCTANGCPITDNTQKEGYAAHIPGEWIIDQAATATQNGSRHKECSVCGHITERDTIPPEDSGSSGGSSSGGSSSGGSSSGGSSSGGSSSGGSSSGGSSSGGSSSGGSSSGGSSSGGSSSGGSSSGGSSTTSTDKSIGTVTETTKREDGSQTVVETGKDGSVTTTETGADGSTVQKTERPDGSVEIVIEQADHISAEIHIGVQGVIQASVKLPSSVTREDGGPIPLPVPGIPLTTDTPSAVTLHTDSPLPVKVTIPTQTLAPGVVVVLLEENGTETVIKTSIPTEDGLMASLPDGATVILRDKGKVFSDSKGHWAQDSITFTTARDLFSGSTQTQFLPDAPMSRAMLMTVLARLDGVDTTGGDTWYDAGMTWAVSHRISDGTEPGKNITREQVAAMLYRYAGSPALPEDAALPFSDTGSISSYALDAIRWCVSKDILNGYEDNSFAPGHEATRAQVAAVLTRYLMNI